MVEGPVVFNAALPEARRLFGQGQIEAALRILADALKQQPEHAEANFLAALCLRNQDRNSEAQSHARIAIRNAPENALYRSLGGDLAEVLGQLGEAEQLYSDALSRDEGLHSAWHGLGVIQFRKSNYESAAQYFARAVQLKGKQPNYRINLAAALFHTRSFEAALPHLQIALSESPNSLLAWRLLGQIRAQLGDLVGAERCFVKALTISPSDAESSLHLGSVFHLRGEYANALEATRHAVASNPQNLTYKISYGDLLCKCGNVEEGRKVLAEALSKDEKNLKVRIAGSLALPGVYRDLAHLEKSRADYSRALEGLLLHAAEYSNYSQANIIAGLGWSNFLLAYQGCDDLQLQKKYSQFQEILLKKVGGGLYQSRPSAVARHERIKIGFVSSFWFDHTVGWYFESWITRLDPKAFEICVYHLNPAIDWLTTKVRNAANQFIFCAGVPTLELAHQIAAAELDILVYPELGMCPTTYLLAGMRLAPLQASGWGHPVSSGHKNVDIRFSPAGMEPENAQEHYCEELLLLPGMGTCYDMPASGKPTSRESIGYTSEDILLIVPQSIFKIHPDNDGLFAEILSRLPNAYLLFFEDLFQKNTNDFRLRLEDSLTQKGVSRTRCAFLPRMGRENFRGVLAACDLMLDTVHWSGGNTSLDALAAGLPLITLPGKYMRGRQSAAMLQQIGLDADLVVQSREAYVEKASLLCKDREYLADIRHKITQAKHRLFNDDSTTQQLQSKLLERVRWRARG